MSAVGPTALIEVGSATQTVAQAQGEPDRNQTASPMMIAGNRYPWNRPSAFVASSILKIPPWPSYLEGRRNQLDSEDVDEPGREV